MDLYNPIWMSSHQILIENRISEGRRLNCKYEFDCTLDRTMRSMIQLAGDYYNVCYSCEIFLNAISLIATRLLSFFRTDL